MKQLFFTLFLFSFVAFSNAQSSKKGKTQQKQQYNKNIVLKVYIDSNANIFVNGKIANRKTLKKELKRTKRKRGIVNYSTSFKGKQTKTQSSKVLALIAEYKIPIQYYTDNSFSEVADW